MGVFISCLSGRALGGLAYISLGMLFRNYLNDLNMGGGIILHLYLLS